MSATATAMLEALEAQIRKDNLEAAQSKEDRRVRLTAESIELIERALSGITDLAERTTHVRGRGTKYTDMDDVSRIIGAYAGGWLHVTVHPTGQNPAGNGQVEFHLAQYDADNDRWTYDAGRSGQETARDLIDELQRLERGGSPYTPTTQPEGQT